jgi:hypothetical protein
MNVCSLLSGKESSVVSPIIYVIFFLFCFVFPPLSFEMMYILLIATYAVLKAHEKYIYIYIYMLEIEKFSVSSPSLSSYFFWLEIFLLSMNMYKQQNYQFDPSLYSYTINGHYGCLHIGY